MINCSRLTEEGAGSRWRVSGGGSRMVTECVEDSESSTVRKQVEDDYCPTVHWDSVYGTKITETLGTGARR